MNVRFQLILKHIRCYFCCYRSRRDGDDERRSEPAGPVGAPEGVDG